MRIALLVNLDLHSNYGVNLLRGALAGHEVALFLSEKVGGGPPPVPQLAALGALEQDLPAGVLWPLAAATAGSDHAAPARFLPFPHIAAALGGTCERLPRPNSPEGLERMRRFAPDLAVSLRYGRILKEDFLAIPPLGVLNLHSGRLPWYRGILPTLRALIHGDTVIGSTVHWIHDGTIDTGPIIGVTAVPVEPGRSLLEHILSVYPPGVELLAETIGRLARGEAVEATPQNPNEGGYYGFPGAEEFAALAARGFPVYDLAGYVRFLCAWAPVSAAS